MSLATSVRNARSLVGVQLTKHSLKKHRSRVGWRVAPKYSKYLKDCQHAYDGVLPDVAALGNAVADFAANGVTSFWTPETGAIASAMLARLQEREAAGEAVWANGTDGVYGHGTRRDPWRDFPELKELFDGPLGSFLTNSFRSHYKILYGTLYKSVGKETPRTASQRWHSDSGPGICINVMFYLNDTNPGSGALEALPWDLAYGIFREEFDLMRRTVRAEQPDASKETLLDYMTAYYDDVIERSYRDKVRQHTGPAGLVVPFLNNTLHRGGYPNPGQSRYAIVFHCYPSHRPTDLDRYDSQGILKTVPYPQDPAEDF